MDRIPIGKTPPSDEDNVVPLHPPENGLEEEMSYEEAMAADPDGDESEDTDSTASLPGSGVAGLIEQGMRVGAGMFSAGATAFADALRATMPQRPSDGDDQDDPAATLAGAGLGAAVMAAEAAATASREAADALAPLVSWIVNPPFAKDATDIAAGATRLLDGQWKAAQAEASDAASAFLSLLIPEITDALFEQIDLTALVRERVDINAIVEDVDLDRIMERVNVDEIVGRVDVQEVIAKVDLDEVVDGVDVVRIIDRVDLDAIVARLDLGAIAQEVIDEVDLPKIVRDSSGAMAGEGVQTVRVQGMNADRFVSKVIDKVLRREARDLATPEPETGQ